MPTPKVARLASRAATGSVWGKKIWARWEARAAKVRKSYHSRKVPKQAAVATWR